MKKIISIIALVLVALSLIACGNKQASGTEKKKLIVAMNAEFAPYEYKENNQIVGIDADMTREIASRLGMEIEFLDIAFDSVIPAIQSGKADIAATGLTVTEERKNFVSFTDMYQDAVQCIVVKEGSDITSVDDIKDKTIGVQSGTTGDMYISQDVDEKNIKRFPKIVDGIQALVSGKLDCCVVDDQVAKACVQENNSKNNGVALKILDTAYVEEHYAMALNKKNTELLEKVNGALRDMVKDGTLASIKAKYIKD